MQERVSSCNTVDKTRRKREKVKFHVPVTTANGLKLLAASLIFFLIYKSSLVIYFGDIIPADGKCSAKSHSSQVRTQ